jgi:hypothetical protein
VHVHQDSFLELWENIRQPPGHVGCVYGLTIIRAQGLEYDEYLRAELAQSGGGGPPDPATVVGLIFAGLAALALILSLASAVYNRRQWRLAQEAQRDGQAILTLNRLCSDLTSGSSTITLQDVENTLISSFHTAETHAE